MGIDHWSKRFSAGGRNKSNKKVFIDHIISLNLESKMSKCPDTNSFIGDQKSYLSSQIFRACGWLFWKN